MVKITSHSDALQRMVEDRAKATLRSVGRKVESSARRIVPVRTGVLRESITHEPSEDELTMHVGSRVHYAGYVEGGTPKMSARPYLRPALMENLRFIKRVFKVV